MIKKVNEDEQWDFCTDDRLARIINDTEKLTKEISKIVYRKKYNKEDKDKAESSQEEDYDERDL